MIKYSVSTLIELRASTAVEPSLHSNFGEVSTPELGQSTTVDEDSKDTSGSGVTCTMKFILTPAWLGSDGEVVIG